MSGLANRTLWLAVALAYGTAACSSVQTLPVTRTTTDARVTVQSSAAFAVHGSGEVACATYRASGTVDYIRGDTVWLRDISAINTRSGEPPQCATLRTGWLVVAGEPAPEITQRSSNVAQTAVLVGVILVVVAVIGAALSLPDNNGSYVDYCPGGTCY